MSTSPAVAERLRAHARLCIEIAQGCWNEETAAELRRMARECAQAAARAEAERNARTQPLH